MNITQSPEDTSEAIDKSKAKSPSDIHKVSENQIVPTRAPSEVEQDIQPGTSTQE